MTLRCFPNLMNPVVSLLLYSSKTAQNVRGRVYIGVGGGGLLRTPWGFGLEKLGKPNLYEFRLNYSVPKVVPKWRIMEFCNYKLLIIKDFVK